MSGTVCLNITLQQLLFIMNIRHKAKDVSSIPGSHQKQREGKKQRGREGQMEGEMKRDR